MSIILYDLSGEADDLRFSPYCWRIKMALKHKGLEWRGVPWRFTDKTSIAFANSTTVPVLVDGETVVADSWTIARYLDATYPDRPSLFGGAQGESHALFIRLWCEQTIHSQLTRLILPDLFARLHPKDKAYFRSSREARLGKTLEAAAIDPAEGIPLLRGSLAPMRAVLEKQPYLGGASASYADYIVFGAFQWARAVSSVKLLELTDPVYAWRDRLLGAFDGFAGSAPGEPI